MRKLSIFILVLAWAAAAQGAAVKSLRLFRQAHEELLEIARAENAQPMLRPGLVPAVSNNSWPARKSPLPISTSAPRGKDQWRPMESGLVPQAASAMERRRMG